MYISNPTQASSCLAKHFAEHMHCIIFLFIYFLPCRFFLLFEDIVIKEVLTSFYEFLKFSLMSNIN